MNQRIEVINLSAIVIEDESYTRCAYSPSHAKRMETALKNGKELPPVLVEKGTNRLVDGVHRYKAHYAIGGAGGTIPVIWVGPFKTRKEFLAAEVNANINHGLRYAQRDLCRSARLLRDAKYGLTQIAVLLDSTVEKVKSMLDKAKGNGGSSGSGRLFDYTEVLIEKAKAIINILTKKGMKFNREDESLQKYLRWAVDAITEEIPEAKK